MLRMLHCADLSRYPQCAIQVKQQKKSSNKWVCVVCNQKQSVRKVFMQAPLASDVRKFVQSFNMKRMLSSSDADQMTVLPRSQGVTSESLDTEYQKKRTDWSEYLDPQEGAEEEGTEQNYRGDAFEPKVVTELPKEMFKNPQLKRPTEVQATEDNKLIKPTFSKKKQTLQGKSPFLRSSTKAASKWSEYLEGDKDDLFIEEASLNLLESSRENFQVEDQNVEDEIHPDFA
ncbi:hypothetical protein QJS10_CPA10g00571 [Acorus calamus]|uniref:MRN complex-interacting protein N-terminal domain-containing protein n=1 Tax=Acorus calamus TaxID=4465 RepID=A0AAV9DY42_ACOCL|nr:hypothetical protein QJS10_CPA10g00571 [Acorus calamus]